MKKDINKELFRSLGVGGQILIINPLNGKKKKIKSPFWSSFTI